jgi:hypothetical protein
LDQRGSSLLINALHPGGDRFGANEKPLGRLFERPPAGCLELEDREAFRGTVEGPLVGRDASHAGVFDAQLLTQQGILFLILIPLGA